MPFNDEMFDAMELADYDLSRNMREEDHDMGIFYDYDDYNPHLRAFDSSFAKIAELKAKGITIPGDSFDGIIEIDENKLYDGFDDYLQALSLEEYEASLHELQDHLDSKGLSHQKQITKEKCWRPKKN